MFGGWYIVGIRDGRSFALVYGPTKTADELPTVDKAKVAKVLASSTVTYTPQPDDTFCRAFLLFPDMHEGCANKSAWLTVTREPWNPT